ncbi:ribokinase [Pseudomonas matsuisoli]|uniref:Ribokinase n=1 Tax=Pseudomonas matsuisoli TaxID=1515666 RepID=A0A917PYK8_9PSED|nr:ribokinase [Pseudomonas matsuisoli]GGJ99605.1 ribokinase [Pseudomonas matsuisoli]
MTRATLISLGSINADFQVRIDQPPGAKETLLARDFCRFAGGKASNTAYLAARFGHPSLLIGRVGDDGLAEQTFAPLRDLGVCLEGVSTAKSEATGVSMILVPPDGKKHIVLASNANDQWDDAAIGQMREAIVRAALPAFLVLDFEVPAAVVRLAVEVAQARGIKVVVDPSFPDRVADDLLPAFLAITPNPDEAEGLSGKPAASIEQAATAAKALRERGVDIVCVKLGDGGCVLATADTLTHLPAERVDVVDSTGAGDAFTGLFAIALSEGHAPREAAAWGVAGANRAVTVYGSQPGYPDREQLLARVPRILERARTLDA